MIQRAAVIVRHAERASAAMSDTDLGGVRQVPNEPGNTLPKSMEGLGVRSVPAIGESQYNGLFIVTIRNPAGATLRSLHYRE